MRENEGGRGEKGEENPRFVADRMLGKLSTWLRILGYDTIYADSIKKESDDEKDEDEIIASFAKQEARILLTRDKNLTSLAWKKGVKCLNIKNDDLLEQLKELLSYHSNLNLEPIMNRCSECNARIREVKEGEEDMLWKKDYVPKSMIGKKEFWICEGCGRIFWEGSHWRNMRERLKQLKYI